MESVPPKVIVLWLERVVVVCNVTETVCIRVTNSFVIRGTTVVLVSLSVRTLWLSVVQRILRAKFYSPPALCLLLRRSYPRTTESRTQKSFVFIDTSPFVRLRQVCLLAGHFFDHASDGFQSSSTHQKVHNKTFSH